MFDEMLKNFGGGQAGDLLQMIGQSVQGEGGLQALAQQAQASGCGDQMSSWVGAGENLPITPDQAQGLLGNDFIQNAAAKLGLDASGVAQMASQMLPQLVDKLTPGGQMPNVLGQLGGLLGGGDKP